MEATAIAQTCYQFKVPFIVTRAVSDLANGEAEISFEEFLGKAAVSSSETVELLNHYKSKGENIKWELLKFIYAQCICTICV